MFGIKEEEPIPSNTMSTNRTDIEQQMLDVVLYPAGGAFNKLRPQQVFLECLLEDTCDAYTKAPPQTKRNFARQHILERIYASGRVLKIFRGRHPHFGHLEEPNEDEALDRITQKLRDIKKRRRHSLTNGTKDLKRRKIKTVAKKVSSRVVPESRLDPWDRVEESDGDNNNDDDDNNLSTDELKDIIWGQWEQIDNWRRLCANQKKTITSLQELNARQHSALVSSMSSAASSTQDTSSETTMDDSEESPFEPHPF